MKATTRRELIAAAAAGATVAAVPPAWGKRLLSKRASVGFGRFEDGVATGDPGTTAVTFWSRLRTDRARSGARLIIARDESMRRVVATAVVPTGRGINGTLKARVGGLKPDQEYFYYWESANDDSPIGRTRTRPPGSSTRPVNIAFSSCQHYGHGYYNVHADAAAQDLDLYAFLGDYIYETDTPRAFPGPRFDSINANDLRSYRRKYELYRSDPALQELHRLHPTVHIWDDHEVANNYSDNDPPPSPLQRAAAYRVAFEWIPRVVYPRERSRVYKRIPLGRTAELFLLDERQYRTGENDGRPRQMLGEVQLRWLLNGLIRSRARWKLIGNQVPFAPMDYGNGPVQDTWGGYPDGRERLMAEIERRGINDVVFLTGDAHVYMVNALATDFETFRTNPNRRPAAVEYVGGSVTSPGSERDEASVRARNPWNRQYNGFEHGYTHMAGDANQLVTEFRRSDRLTPQAPTTTFERFVQPAGSNSPNREAVPPPPPPPPV